MGSAEDYGTSIHFNEFSRVWQDTRFDALGAFERVGSSGWYILGPEVRAFESSLAAYWNLRHAIGVASGLDAIEISLRALGCRPGDLVLTTPLSAFATTLAILRAGAVPVFCDTNATGMMDLTACRHILEEAPEIRYFVPVHLYGYPLDMHELRSLRDDFSLNIIEDCAQSIGATWCGIPTGSVGQCAATSFYPTKNLGAMGDGGAILTADPAVAELARQLRDYGQTAKYRHTYVGCNSRLDELQAAYLVDVCLPRLPEWTARRRSIANSYLTGITNPAVHTLPRYPAAESCWHLFPVFVDKFGRQSLIEHLTAAGIATSLHYPTPIPDQLAMVDQPSRLVSELSRSRAASARELSLPLHPYLFPEEVSRIITAVNAWEPRVA